MRTILEEFQENYSGSSNGNHDEQRSIYQGFLNGYCKGSGINILVQVLSKSDAPNLDQVAGFLGTLV